MPGVRRVERSAEQPDGLAPRERRQPDEPPLAPHGLALDEHPVAMLEFLARTAGAGLVAADAAPGLRIIGIALVGRARGFLVGRGGGGEGPADRLGNQAKLGLVGARQRVEMLELLQRLALLRLVA